MGKGTRIREIRKQDMHGTSKVKKTNPLLKKIMQWVIGVAVVIISVGILVLSSLKNNGTILKRADALKINGTTYKASEVDYYYNTLKTYYENNAYQMYLQYGVDVYGINFSKSLFRQTYDKDSGQSWGDYLLDQAVDELYSYIVMAEEAKKNGFTLNDIHYRDVEDAIEAIEQAAESYGVSVGTYLKKFYGSATTLESYRKYIEREVLSQYYSDMLYKNIEVSQAEVDAEYSKNPNDYDVVTYRKFFFDVELDKHLDENGEEVSDETTKAEDEAKISKTVSELNEELNAVKSEDEFNKLAEKWTRKTDSSGKEVEGVSAEDTLKERVTYKSLNTGDDPDPGLDFLFNASRKAGDFFVNRSEATITVYYFKERDDNSEASRTVRHILLKSSSEDDTVKAQAEAILAEWEAGEKTEASFAALAEKYSDDTVSAVDGGLVEGIGPGATVEEFEDWVMSDVRTPGETGIVYTSNYGYHIVYYVGEGKPYRDVLVDSALRTEKYNSMVDDIKANYTLVRIQSGISKIK